jgi:WD40 repeat protein/tRNA A-37 threonylcarbamoyl transferase component Bud32
MCQRADADASRDLLLALIALQRGLVDRDELLAAFEAWTRSRDRSMTEILASQGALDDRGRTLLEDLVKQHREVGADERQNAWPAVAASRDAHVGPDPAVAQPVAETVAYLGSQPLHRGDPAGATFINERFRIVRHFARGGLGEVFLAVDPELDRQVALKELRAYHAHDPLSQARFLLEARLTGRLEHPGIVPVYGLGRYPDGRPYYAMRLIQGETLGHAIERFHGEEDTSREPGRREIAFRRLLRSLIDACNAVAYAHSRGVVHRDLKPDNIMLGRFGETLVVDWGLAKSMSSSEPGVAIDPDAAPQSPDDSPSLTRPGSALGTPQYMSPEQASGELDRVGPASDVYSLGATLYCLLVGHGPFATGDIADILQRVRRGVFPAPRRLRRSIDPALEAACMKAMALEPEERHATPTALAEEIEAWLADVRYRAEHDRALGDVKRSLARLAIERAGRLFERGMIGEGMLWLARALENVPPDSPGLDRAVRASLGGWHAGGKLIERTLVHRDVVHALAFSPDGRRLATAGGDRLARLWDVATGALLATPMNHGGAVKAVAFNPDGRLAATVADDGALRLWDAVTGEPVGTAGRRDVPVTAVRFSPDGRWLAAVGDDGTVGFWDVTTAEPTGRTIRHEVSVCALAFSPDGRKLLGGCRDGRARIWDAGDGSLLADLSHGNEVGCVAFGPDGRSIASACSGGIARLWDGETGRPIGEPLLHRGPVDCLAFHPEGTIFATGSRDGMARLWDAGTGLAIGPPLEHRGAVHALAFSPDGRRLATGCSDALARCWRVPAPVAGDGERIACWVRVATEREFDEGDAIRPIDQLALWELRRRLQELGGPPVK